MRGSIKPLLLYIMIGLVAVLAGCEDDNDNTNNALVGKWHATDLGFVVTFNADQTFSGNDVEGTWSTSGNELTLTVFGSSNTGTYAISDSGDTLVVTWIRDGGPEVENYTRVE